MKWWENLLMWGGLLISFVFLVVLVGTFCIAIEDIWNMFVRHKPHDKLKEGIEKSNEKSSNKP